MCKKLIYLISFVLVLSLAGDAQAEVNWRDTTGDHNWFTPGNWDSGGVPTTHDWVYISLLPGPIIANEGAVAYKVWVGRGTESAGVLTVEGGTLTTPTKGFILGDDIDSNGTLNMISGTISVGGGLCVGNEGSGTLNMTGGTITNGNVIRIGEGATGIGHVNLHGGIITAESFDMRMLEGSVGTMDVGDGTLIIDGDARSTVQGYIDDPNGWITAYGGHGWLQLDYNFTNEGKTTLFATGGLNMIPANGSSVPLSLNQLQWTLPEPNRPGDVVTCDVYFGTNPSIWDNPKIVTRQAVESVSVTLAINTTYYWAVCVYDPSINETYPYRWSPRFTFYAVANLPPIVNAGDDVASWLVDELPIPPDAKRVVQLNGIVTDDGVLEPYTVDWTVVSEPNSVTHPAVISDASIVNPTITMTALPGLYELELAAYDGEHTSSDTIAIQLYDTSCEHARNQEGFEWLAADINRDCEVDFVDFANFAATWLEAYYSTE